MITSADIAEKFADIPAFSNHQATSMGGFPPYEVREIPGKGFGVVANRTIERGDRIMAHRVLLALHHDSLELSEDDDAEFFNAALKSLPASSLSLYASLAAHHDTTERNVEILNTNSFSEDFFGEEHWS